MQFWLQVVLKHSKRCTWKLSSSVGNNYVKPPTHNVPTNENIFSSFHDEILGTVMVRAAV